MHRRALVGLGSAVLLLGGCSSVGPGQSVVLDPGGQAAVSAEFRVSQRLVAEQAGLVLEGLGRPPGDTEPGLALRTTERLVLGELVNSYAEDNGLSVTQTEIEQGLADLAADNGGLPALEQLALRSGIPVSALEDTVQTNLLVGEIGARLEAEGDVQAQVAAAQGALAAYSEQVEVSVAPRYGTWDDQQLAIVPGTDLSQPAQ